MFMNTAPPKDLERRRRILEWMTGEHRPNELSAALEIPRGTLDQLLRYMQAEGLVERRKQRGAVLWRATGKQLDEKIADLSPHRRREPCLLAECWR